MKTKSLLYNMSGFTLVELMVTVFLTAIAVIAIYRGYTAFSQSADAQQQVMEMHQNLRIGMHELVKDIMRAGMTEEDQHIISVTFPPDYNGKYDVKDVTFLDDPLLVDQVTVGMDLSSGGVFPTNHVDDDRDDLIDGADPDEVADRIGDDDFNDPDEIIRYALNGEDLQRSVWNGASFDTQTIITNVSCLHFAYLKENGGVTDVPSEVDSVIVTLVVRTTNEDYRITNKEDYQNLRGDYIYTAPGDHFRRRAMSMLVKIRNANL